MTDANPIFFDGWKFDRVSGELIRDGNVQRLPPQLLSMLAELLDHPGQVVTRERLVQVLWPKGIVDFDNSLNAVVRRLRVALGDDSEQPRYIETLPRIGYRYIGQLETPPAAAPAAPAATATRSMPPWISRGPLLMALILVILGVLAWVKWPSRERAAPAATSATEPPVRTTNRRAFELYLDGKFNVSRRDLVGGGIAVERFEAALKEDPYFAEAWAALAEAHAGLGITQQRPIAVEMEKTRSAALRAIELNPNLAAGHSALAIVKLQYDRDFAGAEKALRAALAVDSHYSRLWHTYGLLRGHQGRVEESFEYFGRARELEPTTLLYSYSYGNLLYLTRRYDEAIAFVQPLIASQPRLDQGRSVLIRSLLAKGDAQGALAQLPLRYSDVSMISDDGMTYAQLGRRDDALRQIERLERRRNEGFPTSYEIAIVHGALGNLDEACTALRRVFEDKSLGIGWMRLDPRMDPLRGQPCYAEVSKRLYGE